MKLRVLILCVCVCVYGLHLYLTARNLYWLQGLTAAWANCFQQALCLIHLYAKAESYWLHDAWRKKNIFMWKTKQIFCFSHCTNMTEFNWLAILGQFFFTNLLRVHDNIQPPQLKYNMGIKKQKLTFQNLKKKKFTQPATTYRVLILFRNEVGSLI